MLEVTLQLPEEFRHWIEEFLQALIASLGDAHAAFDMDFDDPDMASAWKEGLSDDLTADTDELLQFVGEESFGHGAQFLSTGSAESILRACSALRLKIKDAYLKSFLKDKDSEEIKISKNEMTLIERQSYLCYLFLAILQGTLIQVMDPSLGEFFN
jgi:hypothetical protein